MTNQCFKHEITIDMSKVHYVTTAIVYPNNKVHIGFAWECIAADWYRRGRSAFGEETFFVSGMDEHAIKVQKAAEAAGVTPKAHCDQMAKDIERALRSAGVDFDRFIRTSDTDHHWVVSQLVQKAFDQGDIYKNKYEGHYCEGCEAYYTEKDLVDGKCPAHQTVPKWISEENYFFKLSNYQKQLEEYLSDTTRTVSEPYRKWALEFVSDGLEDLSISRNKSRLDWGIPVPDDNEQVMYVWFDALTNYISTLGWPNDIEGKFEKFWIEGETLQLAGKDQVRFQSIIWQAMLMSADIKQTDKIVYHGFINSGGQKMSKSLGNVISPYELVEKYGTEATRYLLLRHVHPSEDTDITSERLDEWYTANLVNGLGNLVARVMKMAEIHLEEPVVRPEATDLPDEYTNAFANFNLQQAGDYIWLLIGKLDERIATEEPFKLVKIESEKAKTIIRELVQEIYIIARLLNPIMPETCRIIKEAVLANKKPTNLFNRLDV